MASWLMILTCALPTLPQGFLLVTDLAPWPQDSQMTWPGQPQDLTPWLPESQSWKPVLI